MVQTFRQHEILLIGGNGFLGKVTLGLLLDRFPDLKHIYVLVRSKGNLSAEERFVREVLGSPALAGVAEGVGPAVFRKKISVLAGDIGDPDCGLQPEAVERLRGRVSLIINCAGLVDFFPPVDDSFRSNVDGVERVVALAKKISAKLVHVSTCYVCGEADGLVEETEPILGFFPRRKGPRDTRFNFREEIRLCREQTRQIYESARGDRGAGRPQRRSRELTQKLTELGKQRAAKWGWVNTYTYAKSIGEQIIASEEGLDYAIVRPAIVESALRFPFPGWVEGGRTAAPLILMAIGGLKHWTIRRDAPLEVVPVDLVASSILLVSALALNGRHAPVYQLGTADINPFQLEALVKMTLLYVDSRKDLRSRRERPQWMSLLDRPGRHRFVSVQGARTRRIRLQRRIKRAQRVISGLKKMVETAGLPGKRSLARWGLALRAAGLQATFRERTLDLYQPFILHNRYIFESENIRHGSAMLSEKDRKLLPWDPERIVWEDYWINNQVKGVEKWIQPEVLKEWTFKM